MDPNQDGSIADAVDVLSFSGGVDYGTLNSMEAQAAQRVVDLGTVFVASAGNSGNQPAGGSAYISGTPSIARGVIGVAASIDEFIALHADDQQLQRRHDPDLPAGRHHGPPVVVRRSRREASTADLFDGREVDEQTPRSQFCDPVAGRLARRPRRSLVHRGTCAGSTKTFNAQEAGAAAVIIVNNALGAPTALASGGRGPSRSRRSWSRGCDGDAILGGGQSRTGDRRLQRGDRQRHDRRRPDGDPGLRGRDDDFTSEGPARAHERPEAGHLRARVRDRGRGGRAPATRPRRCPAPRWRRRTSRAWRSSSGSCTRAGRPRRSRAR